MSLDSGRGRAPSGPPGVQEVNEACWSAHGVRLLDGLNSSRVELEPKPSGEQTMPMDECEWAGAIRAAAHYCWAARVVRRRQRSRRRHVSSCGLQAQAPAQPVHVGGWCGVAWSCLCLLSAGLGRPGRRRRRDLYISNRHARVWT